MIVVFQRETGEILQLVECPATYLPAYQTETTDALLGVDVSDSLHYVQNGRIVEKPTKPSEFHTWNPQKKVWVADMSRAQQHVLSLWDKYREQQLQTGFTFQGASYQADDRLTLEVLSAATAGSVSFDIRRKDNLMQRFDPSTLQAFSQVLVAFRQSVFTQVFAGKDAIQTATTLEDILALEPPA